MELNFVFEIKGLLGGRHEKGRKKTRIFSVRGAGGAVDPLQQVAALTGDIVSLVEQKVNGQKVMVPWGVLFQ